MANPKIQLRHDTSTNWQTQNPVLLEGEVAIETDNNKVKIGNGTDNYNTLPYIADQTKINLDYSNADYQPVDKLGDTMTGALQISSPVSPQIVIKHTEQVAGTTPTSVEQSTRINFLDSNDTMVGYIQNVYGTDGSRVSMLDSRNADGTAHVNVAVGYNASGTAYCSFPATKCVDGQWVSKSVTIMSSQSLNGSTNLTYTLTDVPNDGYKYEVLLTGQVLTGSTSGNSVRLEVDSDAVTDVVICAAQTRTASTMPGRGAVVLPLTTSRKIYVLRSTSFNGTSTLYLRGYRRIGTNS